MKYLPILFAALCLTGCAMTAPDIHNEMTEAEVNKAMLKAWPPAILQSSTISDDGSMINIYEQRLSNATGDIGTSFVGGKLVKTKFWVH